MLINLTANQHSLEKLKILRDNDYPEKKNFQKSDKSKISVINARNLVTTSLNVDKPNAIVAK